MSFDAIRWAMNQDVEPALTKWCLVAMADCVNAEDGSWEFFASYRHLALRTGMNTKTVESAVYKLREQSYIVDTGKRLGDTRKVVVYRLNDPKTGVIQPGPRTSDANGTRPLNTTGNGVITGASAAGGIPPNPAANPPKNSGQSPQIVGETTPKTGAVSSKGTRKKPGTEPGNSTVVARTLGIPVSLLEDWLKVRNAKRAGPITGTVITALMREAEKARITVEDAVRMCCERGWQGFNASWLAERGSVATVHGSLPQHVADKRETVAKHFPAVADRRGPPPRTIDAEEVTDVTARPTAITR